MKTFRVRETFLSSGWTYVQAENEQDAIEKLENGSTDDGFHEDRFVHEQTDWETLEEARDESLLSSTDLNISAPKTSGIA